MHEFQVFREVLPSLDSNISFCRLLSQSTNHDDIHKCQNQLKNILIHTDAPLKLCTSPFLFDKFLAFCGLKSSHHLVGNNLQQALLTRKSLKRARYIMHRNVVRRVGLNWRSSHQVQAQNARFIKTKKIYTARLSVPYPPAGDWVVESSDIYDAWADHLLNGKRHDKRNHVPGIHCLDTNRLSYDIPSDQDVIVMDQSLQEPVVVVYRNICACSELVDSVDQVVIDSVDLRRNVRMDDTGSLVQVGYSAGARSAPAFDWVHNIISKRTSREKIQDLDDRTSASFALFWNLCRSWLPPCIISDIDSFIEDSGLPLMDSQHRLDVKGGAYSVIINDVDINFYDVLLAPPTGVMSTNYARAIHRERQPHKWAISWMTDRTGPHPFGGAFYVADYGIRISAAKNTLIAWRPFDYHGTSLQLFSPKDQNPSSTQRGIAIVTPVRLPKVWANYLKKKVTREAVMQTVFSDDDLEY